MIEKRAPFAIPCCTVKVLKKRIIQNSEHGLVLPRMYKLYYEREVTNVNRKWWNICSGKTQSPQVTFLFRFKYLTVYFIWRYINYKPIILNFSIMDPFFVFSQYLVDLILDWSCSWKVDLKLELIKGQKSSNKVYLVFI